MYEKMLNVNMYKYKYNLLFCLSLRLYHVTLFTYLLARKTEKKKTKNTYKLKVENL